MAWWLGAPIAFGWRGDSGNLVFDHQGRVLGMYIGGQSQSCDYQAHPPVKAPSIDGIHFISPIHPLSTPSGLQRATIQRLTVRTSTSILFGAPSDLEGGYWPTRGRRRG